MKPENERNSCSVRAIAFAVGVPYSIAHAALGEAGRKTHQGAQDVQILAALATLGARVRMRTLVKGQRMRFKDMLDWFGRRTGTFLIGTKNHVFPIVDGLLIDPPPKMKHRVEWVIEVS